MRPLPAHLAGAIFTQLISHGALVTPSPPAQLQPALLLPCLSEAPTPTSGPVLRRNAPKCPWAQHCVPETSSSLQPEPWVVKAQLFINELPPHQWNSALHPPVPQPQQCLSYHSRRGLILWQLVTPQPAELVELLSFGLWFLFLTGIKHIAFKSQALKAKIHQKNALNHKASVTASKPSECYQREPGPFLSPPALVFGDMGSARGHGPSAAPRGAGLIFQGLLNHSDTSPHSLFPVTCAQPSNTSQKQKICEV